jgi:hypothetical protein
MEIQMIERISKIEITIFAVLMILEMMILFVMIVALLLAMNNSSVCDQIPSQEDVQCGWM